jgi:hypothetical protein
MPSKLKMFENLSDADRQLVHTIGGQGEASLSLFRRQYFLNTHLVNQMLSS